MGFREGFRDPRYFCPACGESLHYFAGLDELHCPFDRPATDTLFNYLRNLEVSMPSPHSYRYSLVTFGASTKEYAYENGDLQPVIGQFVIVPVGKDNSLKIVKVTNRSDHEPFATKPIWGVVVTQEDAQAGRAAILDQLANP